MTRTFLLASCSRPERERCGLRRRKLLGAEGRVAARAGAPPKAENQGWKINRIKIDEGCYEVYGTDGKGQRAETYFNPKTLDPASFSSAEAEDEE